MSATPIETPVQDEIQSTRSLVAVNVFTLSLAMLFDWPVVSLLAPYWLQSVVIGYYSRKRMLALKRFSVEGFRINDKPAENTPATQRSTANFFAFHYGFFHFGYLVFLAQHLGQLTLIEWLGIVASGWAFAWNHRQSFERNLPADMRGNLNIGALMFLPYLRIVPMHLTIIFGGALVDGRFTLLLFGSLKTVADVLMHHAEHRILQRGNGMTDPAR